MFKKPTSLSLKSWNPKLVIKQKLELSCSFKCEQNGNNYGYDFVQNFVLLLKSDSDVQQTGQLSVLKAKDLALVRP